MKRLLLSVALFGWATCASAQVAFDAASSQGLTASITQTLSHTIGTCANCGLVIGVVWNDLAKTTSTVVWNGSESAARLCTGTSSGNTMELWYRAAPTTGTHNVVVTFSGSVPAILFALSASSVASAGTAVCDAYVTNGTTHNHDATGATNGLGVDVFEVDASAGTITVNGGQTTRTGPVTNDGVAALLTTIAGTTTTNMGESWVNDFYRWAHGSVVLLPSSSGPCLMALLGVGKCA